MTTALSVLRQMVAERVGDWWTGAATSDGAADGTTLLDTGLKNKFANDNATVGWWELITSGTYINIARKVSTFTQTSGTQTMQSAFGAGKILTLVTHELHRYDPQYYVESINEAIRGLFNHLWQDLRDETLIACNAIPNGNFEDWTGNQPDYWSTPGGVLGLTKETTAGNYLYGKASLKITGGATADYIEMTQAQWPALLELQNHNPIISAWVKTDTASHCRLAVVDDDGTTYSDYHTGSNKWEKLTVQRSIKADTKTIAIRIYGAVNTKLAYVDQIQTDDSVNIYQHVLPKDFEASPPDEVWMQNLGSSHSSSTYKAPDDLTENCPYFQLYPGRHYRFDNIAGGPRLLRLEFAGGNRKLRLIGRKPLSTFATTATLPCGTGADTTELDSPRTELLIAKGAACLLRRVASETAAQESGRFKAMANDLLAEVERLKRVHGMARSPITLPRR